MLVGRRGDDHHTTAVESETTVASGIKPFSKPTRERARTLGTQAQESVVRITTDDGGGTGWIIDDGYILTNSHIVQDTKSVAIETFDGQTGTATRVGYHQDLFPDIALLKTNFDTPPPLSMSTVSLSHGDVVLAVGHPITVGEWAISLGRYDHYNAHSNWLLATIPTEDGNSGSPLLTLDGDVVGCINGTTRKTHTIERMNRSHTVYTAYPKKVTVATATPARTIAKWMKKWR
ncbi:trypsin-like peptidase domain-containing protein [Haladaptatus sp. CMAA 1911]|uniref:trypsin-like peptidase domain-containing protein n=1 Tax=unclassified Haladaptatus TaxID=2622732 RepID=UPI003753EBE2